jgi:dTDP-4-amino-4,6-dideoxygalactose transaminase
MTATQDIGKRDLDDLAFFGGPRLFDEPLHVGRPNLGNLDEFDARVRDIFSRNWLTNNGPYVQEFEREIERELRVAHCVAVCNGTVALEIMIRAVGLSGEVIVPSFTFVASAHALRWQQITPVFGDIDPESHTLDPARIEGLITPRTTGILGVHLWGRPCDIDGLTEVARRHRLHLVFDAAHAFGCSWRGRMIGNFGEAEVLSFHATKFVHSLEGGAIVTNDDALAERLRLMRNFGFAGEDEVVEVGTNGKMSEVSAAMGLTNLASMPDFVEVNHRNYSLYQKGFAGLPGITLTPYPDDDSPRNYQYIVIQVDEARAGVSRNDLRTLLSAENVLARRYFWPAVHRMEPYRSDPAYTDVQLPETDRLAARTLALPTGMATDEDRVGGICALIRFVVERGLEVGARLAEQSARP